MAAPGGLRRNRRIGGTVSGALPLAALLLAALLLAALLLAALLLAGCAGGGDWHKPGADATATDRDYHACAAAATQAVDTETRIDQDIQATEGGDWQRSHMVPTRTGMMNGDVADRSDAIVAGCMQAKGFSKRR